MSREATRQPGFGCRVEYILETRPVPSEQRKGLLTGIPIRGFQKEIQTDGRLSGCLELREETRNSTEILREEKELEKAKDVTTLDDTARTTAEDEQRTTEAPNKHSMTLGSHMKNTHRELTDAKADTDRVEDTTVSASEAVFAGPAMAVFISIARAIEICRNIYQADLDSAIDGANYGERFRMNLVASVPNIASLHIMLASLNIVFPMQILAP